MHNKHPPHPEGALSIERLLEINASMLSLSYKLCEEEQMTGNGLHLHVHWLESMNVMLHELRHRRHSAATANAAIAVLDQQNNLN